MKKSIFMVALAALAMTSCSQDEVLEVKKDAMSFSAFTENASRATAVQTGSLGDFIVYANENGTGTPYIKGVTATKDNSLPGEGNFRLAQTYYWPENSLDFYCIYPADVDGLTPTSNVPSVVDYACVNDGTDYHAEDLLYSVSLDTEKGANGIAQINFRHALAMIDFKAVSLVDYALDVTINSVTIKNISNTATYSLGDCEGTDSQVTTTTDVDANYRGKWSGWNAASESYLFNFAGVEMAFEEDATEDLEENLNTEPYFIMPQELTADETKAQPEEGKSYFVINCEVTKNDVVVNSGDVFIPVSGEWKEGYKYTYTFIFGKGAGYENDLVTPVIVPISFNCTVDEFIADPIDVDMEAVVAP